MRIIKAGVLDSVQDMGRYGWQHLGINPGGVMDIVSARLANILVGNEPDEAVIELHFPASEFFFESPALIAVSGADFSAHVNGEEIDLLHPVLLSKYSILQFHRVKKGARAYLSVYGGLNIPAWLGSCSTHLKAGMGGFKGRALQKNDDIPMRSTRDLCPLVGKKEYQVLPWRAEVDTNMSVKDPILVLPGHEWDMLDIRSKVKFLGEEFAIAPQSDRMGYKLLGPFLAGNSHEEIVSTAVNFGTIQLLPGGHLIVLMADHQTTGGYPRIGHVISAHRSRLAQLKPGDTLRFRLTDLQTAEGMLIQQNQHLKQLQNACKFRLDEFLDQ